MGAAAGSPRGGEDGGTDGERVARKPPPLSPPRSRSGPVKQPPPPLPPAAGFATRTARRWRVCCASRLVRGRGGRRRHRQRACRAQRLQHGGAGHACGAARTTAVGRWRVSSQQPARTGQLLAEGSARGREGHLHNSARSHRRATPPPATPLPRGASRAEYSKCPGSRGGGGGAGNG